MAKQKTIVNQELDVLLASVVHLKNQLDELNVNTSTALYTDFNVINCVKRRLYSDASLALIEIDRLKRVHVASPTDIDVDYLTNKSSELRTITDSIPLSYIVRKHEQSKESYIIINKIDEVIRILAVWSCLIACSIVFALPCILVKPIDSLLVNYGIISPYYQISVLTRRFISSLVLEVSGISLTVEGREHIEDLDKGNSIICWSHSSTMDAFVIPAVVPVRAYTLAKSELFLIPFFSWLLIAFNAIPIIRNDHKRAIASMKIAVTSAKAGDCVSVAPEGTRSKSGQLMEFKKGPFHTWEQLDKCNLVPIVSFGVFELYPPGKQMTIPGKVYVRFLEPIIDKAISRDDASIFLHKKMLLSLKDVPLDASRELTTMERIRNIFAIILMFFVNWLLYRSYLYFTGYYFNIKGTKESIMYGFGLSIIITLLLYVYSTYISNWLITFNNNSNSNNSNNSNSSNTPSKNAKKKE